MNVTDRPMDFSLTHSQCINNNGTLQYYKRVYPLQHMESSECDTLIPAVERAPLPPQSFWVFFLPDVAEIVLEYLDEVDTCGYLDMICKDWTIKATERTYKRLCHTVYLNQTERKTLNVLQFGGSWKRMLKTRPRLRTNGVYWLRTSTWKQPHNDMFWEEKICEFIESIHFRHIRFFDDGRLLYILNNKWPIDTASDFNAKLPVHKKIFDGVYTLHKNVVHAEVYTHYRTAIKFSFLVQDLCAAEEGGYPEHYRGKFNVLKMTSHASVPMLEGNTVGATELPHSLPDYCNFKFHRVREWG